MRTYLSCVALSLLVVACSSPTPGGGDTGPSGRDTGGAAVDTGTTTGSDSGGGGDVAACQAAVDAVIAACMAEASPPANRLCLYNAYRNLCAQGRTSVVTAMMNCLSMDSCQSAADPSAAASCVAGVVAANQNAAHMALGAAVCTCEMASPEPGCPTFPQYSGAELLMGTDADVQTVTTCLTGMTTCTSPNTCYGMIPFGAAFLACTP